MLIVDNKTQLIKNTYFAIGGDGLRRRCTREYFSLGEIPDVNRMHDEEQQSPHGRDVNQEPSDMNGDVLSPRTSCPLY